MIKRLATIAAVFFFLAAAISNNLPKAQADTTIPTTITQSTAMSSAASVVPATNMQNDNLQYIPPPPPLQVVIGGVTYSYGYLAYGEPHGNFAQNHYRYAGYDWRGEDETNLAFPPDQNANGADFTSANWIPFPWLGTNHDLTGAQETPWDGDISYTEDLLYGILYSTGSYGNTQNVNGYTLSPANGNNQLWANITNYAHVLMPPTQYTWGIARMWHLLNGTPWYVTIPMPPLALVPILAQPALVVSPATASIYVGQTQGFKATYYRDWLVNPTDFQDVTGAASWVSSDPSVAPVNSVGVATGKSPGGLITITASYEGLSATGQLLVSKRPTPPPPPQTGSFLLQAESQIAHDTGVPDGTPLPSGAVSDPYVGMIENVRPPGTAEWTDYVTATVSPPTQSQVGTGDRGNYSEPADGATIAPPEPGPAPGAGVAPPLEASLVGSYSIMDSYSVQNGTLIYPLQSPDYSWGNPTPPEGTTSTPLTPTSSGHSATGTFRENWAHDGVPVIDLNGDEVAQYPKDYTITAQYQYTVNYHEEYDYQLFDPFSGNTWNKTVFVNNLEYSPSQPLEMSTQLKVDGTGALY